MGDKFTIRDFFSYLLCGCCVFICVLIIEFKSVNEFFVLHKNFFIDNTTLVLFVSLPIIYFTGQYLQSLDMLLYFFGREINKRIDITNNTKLKVFYKKIYKVVSYHRITGNLNKKQQNLNEFWTKCNSLELASKYNHAEYSYILNDMFKGIFILTFICSIYTLIKGEYLLTIFFIFSSFISWLRALHFANIFVDTVINTYNALLENRNFEKK
jgi:hypothetical protein